MAGQAGLEPATFWATRKGGTPAASPSVGVYYAGAGQPRTSTGGRPAGLPAGQA